MRGMNFTVAKVDAVVTGAGGFIGGHLVKTLLQDGRSVRAVDKKSVHDWYQVHDSAENLICDVSLLENARAVLTGKPSEVYNLAADMGGMGFIESHKAECMLSVLTSTHVLLAARDVGVERYFYSSSACVYAADKQEDADAIALKEDDAYPAMPEDGYGWEKLFSERMARHFREDYGVATRVGRFHNVYGPHGTWEGGREKAPAAICRKVATAALTGRHEIEIWGDGEQTRSFMFVDDCVKGTLLLTRGDFSEPMNIGSSEMVTINELVDTAEEIAGITVKREYDPEAPKGVRGRNSDNTLIQKEFGWEPSTSLRDGLELTYRWIYDQIAREFKK